MSLDFTDLLPPAAAAAADQLGTTLTLSSSKAHTAHWTHCAHWPLYALLYALCMYISYICRGTGSALRPTGQVPLQSPQKSCLYIFKPIGDGRGACDIFWARE
jgi:hypothetical protein